MRNATSTILGEPGTHPREAVGDTQHQAWKKTMRPVVQKLLHRIRCWYTDSYPTCDTGDYEPPWLSGRRANLANCRFYQIPEELVLQILGNLDYVSRAMARRTCGLLLRISFDRTLVPETQLTSNTNTPHHTLDIAIWPPLEQPSSKLPSTEGIKIVKQVNDLLDRDRFCRPCREFRNDGRYETALQALQRRRYCYHCSRSHERPFFSARQMSPLNTSGECILAEGTAQFCGHLFFGRQSLEGAVSPGEHPCRHPDHDPPLYTRLKDSLKGVRSCAYRRPHLVNFDVPKNAGEGPWRGPSSTVTFFVAHLHHGVPVTRKRLQEKLDAKAHVLNKMLCPHITAGDGQLLLPFGPDRCGCFQSPRWIGHDNSFPESCCRCKADRYPNRAGYFLPGLNLDHRYECPVCLCEILWRRKESAVYLEIKMLNRFDHKTKWPSTTVAFQLPCREFHWIFKIHPESWGITDDEELRHVAWCDDITCRSRWRWESLARLWEARLEVKPDQ
ncbi:hypothetical protein V8F20_002494 [Naviculisporaceae sp. PSN 640]